MTVASYTWLSDGTKCAVVDNTTNGYDYLGSLIYSRNGSVRTPESIDNGSGRIIYSGGTYNSHYYITDHLGSTRVITDNSGSVVERDDYYPFGGQLAISSYPQLSVNRFKFNGKELQTTGNTGFLDYGARMYDDVIGRWGVVDPKAEKFYSLSPYTAFANNPLLFIDPTGEEIFIYHWVSDGDGGGQWVQGHMNKDTQKQLEAFAKTKEGYAFLSKYAKAGQKIGSVEFKADGKYADQNLNFNEFDSYASPAGTYSMREGKDKLNFDIQLNTAYMDEPNGKEAYSLTIGHEAFIHIDQVDDKLIKAFKEKDTKTFNLIKEQEAKDGAVHGDIDHKKYINGDPAFSRFNTYSSQLKQVLNPQSVEKAKKEHDAKYSRLLIKK
jgi:RHS repeat-associated protein